VAIIRSVRTAIRIVNCLSLDGRALGISEIADSLGMNVSTVHHIAATLCAEGVLMQNRSRKYRLGSKVLEWGGSAMQQQEAIPVAAPHMRHLAQTMNETCHLALLDGCEVVYIAKIESKQSVRIATSIGSRKEAYCTALGKALLAFQPPAALEGLARAGLAPRTPSTITSMERLASELRRVRREGYAVDDEEYEEGLFCVAAPIYDYTGQVALALSLSGPSFRLKRIELRHVAGVVTRTAAQISRELGCPHGARGPSVRGAAARKVEDGTRAEGALLRR
jgi:DNA-binding IclR family transcriptional regulator